MMRTQPPKALYIHIPFCTNKCFYCDFNSFVLKGQPVEDYLEALEQEMVRTVETLPPQTIETVFVGGGTPTVLTPPQMEQFLAAVRRHFPLSEHVEFTMEANPGTTDPEKLRVMRAGGVNRISFGVQSFDNHLLERIGRIHNVDDVYRSIDNARAAGFDNLSIDLMFNLPDQTLSTLDDSVSKALELGLPHYSLYGLKVEENTLFHTLYQRDELPLPSEDEELEMYLLIMNRLKQAGREQYEISNFALPGFESRHNMTYWRNEPYYGLGAGAHGYDGSWRHINVKGVQAYNDAAARGLPRLETRQVELSESMEDFMMVGLRLLSGVTAERFRQQYPGYEMGERFGDTLERLVAGGLLEFIAPENRYRLTERGVLLGNEVFGAFIS